MAAIALPILFAAFYGLIAWRLGISRLKRQLDATAAPLEDAEISHYVRRLGKAAGVPDLKAHVMEMPVANGLAAPDGRIFITSGFLEKHRFGQVSGEEIASVIAHELGHVALGHHKRRLIDFTGQNAARVALGMTLNRVIPIVGVYLANFLVGFVGARLSQRDEFEADAYAAALMVKAELPPGAQISLFEKLPRLIPGAGGPEGGAAWLASHPPTRKRIRRIEELHRQWGVQTDQRVAKKRGF